MIEPEENMSATESEEETIAAKKDMEERSPEGHDPNDERGGGLPGGEAGAVPGMPASERMNEKGHEARARAFAMKRTTRLDAAKAKVSGIALTEHDQAPVAGSWRDG